MVIALRDHVATYLTEPKQQPRRAAEFFAGIGLVREALQRAGWDVVYANDVEPFKRDLYVENFGSRDFVLGDVRNVHGSEIPDIELATASFPCTDISLAGNRRGLDGAGSSLFWEFVRVLSEMEDRSPQLVLVENVPSFKSVNDGDDLYIAIRALNEFGYSCDLLEIDAKHYVPQSRKRLFIVGSRRSVPAHDWIESTARPEWILQFARRHPDLHLHAFPFAIEMSRAPELEDVVERLPPSDLRWWDAERVALFQASLSPRQSERLNRMRASLFPTWATAYRRTRNGRAVWEIRGDHISGCLRTARGGSSKQALVETHLGELRVRWMTPREYARLQGAPDFLLPARISVNKALFGFGDAVCVPVVESIARQYLGALLPAINASD